MRRRTLVRTHRMDSVPERLVRLVQINRVHAHICCSPQAKNASVYVNFCVVDGGVRVARTMVPSRCPTRMVSTAPASLLSGEAPTHEYPAPAYSLSSACYTVYIAQQQNLIKFSTLQPIWKIAPGPDHVPGRGVEGSEPVGPLRKRAARIRSQSARYKQLREHRTPRLLAWRPKQNGAAGVCKKTESCVAFVVAYPLMVPFKVLRLQGAASN